MTASIIQFAHELVSLTCWAKDGCGIQFAVPQRFYRQAEAHGFSFYCPRGHLLCIGEGEVAKLKKQLESKDSEIERQKKFREWAEEDARKARHGQRTVAGKLKAQSERVKNGVCPCCNRTFQNLMRHMATKHPEWSSTHDRHPA